MYNGQFARTADRIHVFGATLKPYGEVTPSEKLILFGAEFVHDLAAWEFASQPSDNLRLSVGFVKSRCNKSVWPDLYPESCPSRCKLRLSADVLLALLLPILILTHLIVAPYTKVEESFNIQAIHDISNYGLPIQNISSSLHQYYDHFEFPGAVPRTFVGALALAGVSKPWIGIIGTKYAQLVVRAVLGIFNAYALLRYKAGLERAFGRNVGRWYILLQASQFHVVYYASRTLPNMFAFGLSGFLTD